MNQRKILTLCIITKNDQKYIGDCMRNMERIADETIIADIGSNDGTIGIAKKQGAVVYQINWENDYSKIKNFCMDHANGRWVLFLQANETMEQQQIEKLPRLLDNPNVEGYLIFVDYNSQQYCVSSPVQSLRLIRNHKENRFRYRSFEAIPDEILTGIKDANIQIKQQFDAVNSWQFSTRSSLLKEEVKENPADSYLNYMYGILLLNQNALEKSIEHFQRARANINFGYLFTPHLYKCLSWALLYLQRHTDALFVLNEGIVEFPYYTDLLVLRGELHKELEHYDEALTDLESCLDRRQQPNTMVPGSEIDSSAVLEMLGETYERISDIGQALNAYREAYELDSTNNDLLDKITELANKNRSQ